MGVRIPGSDSISISRLARIEVIFYESSIINADQNLKRIGMNERVSHTDGGSRRGLLTLLIVALPFIPLAMGGQSSPSRSATDETSGRLLPRNFVVTLRLVSQLFPEIVQQSSTGRDLTAVGNPEATRAVFFTNGDGSKLVTVTVDRYRTSNEASDAYREALDRSRRAPGFKPISLLLNVGQEAFAGTANVGDEVHVGLGALDGTLIVGATLAGFQATLDNFINLVALACAEDAAANAANSR